jgi:transposase
VTEALNANPYCGNIFIFRSKRADRLKLIAWDGTGMVLVTKWLEAGHFVFPKIQDGAMVLTGPELSVLLAGLDWMFCCSLLGCRFALKISHPTLRI